MQIKDLPELTSLTDNDIFLIQSEGITKKVKASTLKTYLGTEIVTPPPVVSNLKLDCPFTTNLLDSKGNTVTGNSGVSIFNGALKMADGNAQLYVTPTTLSDFSFPADFSISCDLRIDNYQSYQIIIENTASGGNGWVFYLEADSTVSFISGDSGFDNLLLHKVFYPTIGTFYHVEVKRQGNTLSMLSDGVIVRQGAFTPAVNGTGSTLRIGNRANASYWLNGALKNLKITKG
jgi:hypothetical protein